MPRKAKFGSNTGLVPSSSIAAFSWIVEPVAASLLPLKIAIPQSPPQRF